MNVGAGNGRVPVVYLAPWVDYGGSDKGTIDWLRWLDRDRFAPVLVTTQPSDNRMLKHAYSYAHEVWPLPEFLAGPQQPAFIFDLIHTRGIEIVHIMNSRLGYDLLPDLAALPNPPAVVVQLHVEEPDKSGYVRYVTTRYGNLVDAFSVSSQHLADAVAGYDVASSKVHVIPTGIDAEVEFNPALVTPIESIDPDDFNILVPGRLTDQKDPLLMTEVIRRIAPSYERLRVHVVGDGPLGPEVRAAVRTAGLDAHFRFHPPSREIARWYAASDLLLMTSVFEGVPYVAYEAMAMEVPIVAPALPGNVELMDDTAGVLVAQRDHAGAYADAIAALTRDGSRREALAGAGRNRVLEKLGVRSMGRLHAQLYDAVLQARGRRSVRRQRARSAPSWENVPALADERAIELTPPPLRFTGRPAYGRPLVSVVMPCFNHGRFLHESVRAILEQDYPELEAIVVDDRSTDGETPQVLDQLSQQDRVRVIWQTVNQGPSVARNRAITDARGRYIFPVDADNILLPGAIDSLVRQLQGAGERVGYIYPNLQYFGTRDEYYEPPRHNLALLLDGNYCDTCSLIDRQIFDAGMRYSEDIRLGHEDWDFALTLAERGVIGLPAQDRTLLYRKHGFTRSDAVEYARRPFRARMVQQHPRLYGDEESVGRRFRWSGPAAEIKAHDAPGLSCVMTSPLDLDSEEGGRLLRRLEIQSCRDLELILECESVPAGTGRVRRIPPGLCADRASRLQEGLMMARAPVLLIAGEEMVDLLGEPGLVEKLYRTFWASPQVDAIAFTDARERGRFPYRLLKSSDIREPAHALAWLRSAERRLPTSLQIDDQLAAESLAGTMSSHELGLQWRHCAARPGSVSAGCATIWLALPGHALEADPHRRAERRMTATLPPSVPSLSHEAVPRWLGLSSWVPPESTVLARHHNGAGERRITIGRAPPSGFALEYDLGAVRCFAPPGTVRLVEGESGFRTVPRGALRDDSDVELGHLELAPLPLLEPLARAVLSDGSETLVAGERDPLRADAVQLEFLGFIEAFPINPPLPPDARDRGHGITGLLRALDRDAKRHVYSVGTPAPPELVGELGALHLVAEPGSIAVSIIDGRVVTSAYAPALPEVDLRKVLRWVAAPVGWRRFGHTRGRARSVARRALDAALLLAPASRDGAAARAREMADAGSASTSPELGPVGFLYPRAGAGRVELFAATHPVTGDQLLTLHRLEAADMGYGDIVSLGFVLERAPVTGTLALKRVSVPWASRYGLEVRG